MSKQKVKLPATFNRMFSASLVSHIADGLLATAAPLLAATLTHDPVLISGIAALVMLPWLLFGVPIGALLDRVNRRTFLALASVVKLGSAAAVSIFITTGVMNIWLLYLTTFLVGVSEVVSDTAMQSMVPQLLKQNQIETANSRMNLAQTILGQFVGTPLGGLLYAVAIWVPFAFNSLGFAVAALLLFLIPLNIRAQWDAAMVPEPKEPASFWQDIKFGVQYLYRDKLLLRLVVTTSAIGFLFNVSTSTSVLLLLKVLHLPEALFGVVITIEGVGAILGSLYAVRISKKFGRSRAMAFAITGSCLTTGLSGFMPNIITFVLCTMTFDFLIAVWNILLMSTYHEMIPNNLFSRIHGTRRTLVWGLMPVGAIVGGFIARIDLRSPYLATLIVGSAIAIISYRFISTLPQKSALAEDDGSLTIH